MPVPALIFSTVAALGILLGTMPTRWDNSLRYLMQTISPTLHFVSFAQAVLYRGTDFFIVWPLIVVMAAIGSVYFAFALRRFRRVISGG